MARSASVAVVALLLGLWACSGDGAARTPGVRVVATTSVLADVVGDLVGERGSVEALMEAGADPHDFTPTAEQAARLRSADLVVANGLGLEAGLSETLESAAADGAAVVELADRVDPLPFGHHADGHGEEHQHRDLDPHFVLDPLRVADAVDVVAEALSRQDDSVEWQGRAAPVREELESLHRDIQEQLSVIPDERRKLVTNHDALGYFADRYGFDVVATVIPGGSTLAEPSAADLADLADLLRREGVRAVFTDTTASPDLAETVAAEVGGEVRVHRLYTGSLGPEGSGAETYGGMMRANAATISGALGG